MHRLLFAAPVGRTAQDDGLAGLGMACELDLDAFLDLTPAVWFHNFGDELLQLRLRCTDDVASARWSAVFWHHGYCPRTLRSRAENRRRSRPGRSAPACGRDDDRANSRAWLAGWLALRLQNRCS